MYYFEWVVFQRRFQCVQMPNQVLESISIIDTPGILTAAKRKLSRGEMEQLSDFLFPLRRN